MSSDIKASFGKCSKNKRRYP